MIKTLLLLTAFAGPSAVVTDGPVVTIMPETGQAKVIRLQVMNDDIIRVRATSETTLPEKRPSLMIVPQTPPARGSYSISEAVADGKAFVEVKTSHAMARVNKHNGQITFLDGDGQQLLQEHADGKRFWPFTVPEREYGLKGGQPLTEEMKHGLQWQMLFDSPDDEAFYGLGQHQSEELNMKGRNEDLFQYNTKVSIPFMLSSRNYGLLWDSYSFCRFGKPDDYQQLHRVFRLYDKDGRSGHLTGTYTDRDGKTLVRDEDSLYYEYGTPEKSEIARKTDNGGIRNLPQGFRLDGARVVYEGFLEAIDHSPLTVDHSPLTVDHSPLTIDHSPLTVDHSPLTVDHLAARTNSTGNNGQWSMVYFQFILYYAGYVRVYIGGEEVVAERWRTAWNPNAYKFECQLPQGEKTHLRIEWEPDGGESYLGLRVAEPRSHEERGRLSIWSEMARDMDYYFIAGRCMDDVIAGYRTLTGRASLYPKWALGFWQSRERYKTSAEVEQTLAEFRRRHIPIDNIVQDWNYWPEDQWGSHQFEASRYPDPQAMIDSVHQMHGRFMISVWPKFYCNTDNYKQLDSHGWIYRQSPTDDIHDWVGPGYKNGFYDAYDPDARKLFWQQMDEKLYTGLANSKIANRKSSNRARYALSSPEKCLDAWWMDASEPNVRDCTPMWYRKALCGPTALGTSTEYFNAYSLVNADAIYNGQRGTWNKILNSKLSEPRVFLLTRSGFAGLQRYSTATWSGDIGTRWEDMRAQMTAGLNFSISGIPFWGMDQGGFCVERRYVTAQQLYDRTGQENEDLKEWRELQTRWAQFGTFIPLFRSHGQWPLREIWNIAPDDHPAYRSFVYYDRLRYRLMPYLYSLAAAVHFNHYTMMRPLVMDFGSDPNVFDIADQWMLGPSLMACPVSHYKARNRAVYFPADRQWYDLYTGKLILERGTDSATQIVNRKSSSRKLSIGAPYERIPVFVTGGSIIPFGPDMEWSDEHPAELIRLYVYAGRDGSFTLYEDEGTNYNYEKGQYSTIPITYDDTHKTVTIGQRKGHFNGMLKQRRFHVVYITPDHPQPLDADTANAITTDYDGRKVTIALTY